MQVSLSNPQYSAAMSKLEADDRHRSDADFTLTDVHGKSWNLRHLRGRVVLVNFWATWCPPCRKEIPDLNELHRRFEGKDLVILSISGEVASTVKPFLAEREINYPALLDPGDKVRNLFLVTSLPYSLVYDREGHLVAQAIDRLTLQGFLEMVGRAGLQ
jgi:peroxiredoxin